MRSSLAMKVGLPLLLLALGGLGALLICAHLLRHAAAHEALTEHLTTQRLLGNQLGLNLAAADLSRPGDRQQLAQAATHFREALGTLRRHATSRHDLPPPLTARLQEVHTRWARVEEALARVGTAPRGEGGRRLAEVERARREMMDALEAGIAVYRQHTEAQQREALRTLGALALAELGLLGVAGWFLSTAVLGPVRRLTATAHRLRAGNLSARARLEGRDELADFGGTLDRLADALEQRLAAVTGEREVARAHLRAMLAQAPLVLLTCDAGGRLTLVEGSAVQRLLHGDGALVGRSIFTWEAQLPWLAEGVRRALRGEQARVEGEREGRTWSVQCEPFREEGEARAGALLVGTDVTEMREASTALRRSREELAALLESIQASIWSVDRDLQLRVANTYFAQEYERVFGIPLQTDFLAPLRARAPALVAHWEGLYARALRGEHVLTEETSHEEGPHRRTHLVSVFPIRGPEGVRGAVCNSLEITELRRAEQRLRDSDAEARRALERRLGVEEALRQSEERFTRVFHASPVPILLVSLEDGRILDLNESALEASGYTREELLGRPVHEVHIWMDPQEEQEVARALQRAGGRIGQREVHLRRKDGSPYVGLASFVVITLQGRPCMVTMAQDITQYRRLEEQLRQTAKMEAIGQLAGGVAHDFNNLLTVITGGCELLRRRPDVQGRARALVEQVLRAAHRGAGLTRQLLAFSRKQTLRTEALEVNRVVADMEAMLCRLIGEDIELRTELEAGPACVRGDRSQLEQVLLNLAVNARDAMPHGGTLTLRTAAVGREALGEAAAGAGADAYVLLEVRDTGVGMPPEVQAHLFEPFFTTKEPGKGTGLGLSTVYGIVRQSGGWVQVESAPGRGSTFRVYLPQVAPEVRREASPGARVEAPRGEETLLLVEDEEEVRVLLARVLTAQGYRVLAAADGAEAEALARRHPGPIHLLLTDVVMPRMRGPEVARRLCALRPGLRVLYMSGYPGGRLGDGQADVGEEAALLSKPFSTEALVREVQAVLARAPGEQHPLPP